MVLGDFVNLTLIHTVTLKVKNTTYSLQKNISISKIFHKKSSGAELPPSRLNLIEKGDFMGTFMAWLKDVEAGGKKSI